jgi:hypothetical protein
MLNDSDDVSFWSSEAIFSFLVSYKTYTIREKIKLSIVYNKYTIFAFAIVVFGVIISNF